MNKTSLKRTLRIGAMLLGLLCFTGCAATDADLADEGVTESGEQAGEEQVESHSQAATASQLPGGSWWRTCPVRDPFSDGFSARCKRRDGSLGNWHSVYRGSCHPFCAWNDNGRLRCGSC